MSVDYQPAPPLVSVLLAGGGRAVLNMNHVIAVVPADDNPDHSEVILNRAGYENIRIAMTITQFWDLI